MRAEKSRNHTHTGVSRSPLRPITTRDDSHDHLITLHESKYVTHESDDKHTHRRHTHPTDPPRARARSTPPFEDARRRVDNHGGACSLDDSRETFLLRSMTRSRLAREGCARVRSVAEVVPPRSRGSRADGLDGFASRARSVTSDERAPTRTTTTTTMTMTTRARPSSTTARRARRESMMMDEGAGKP